MPQDQTTIPYLESAIKHLLDNHGKDTLALLITQNPTKILQTIHNVLKKMQNPPDWLDKLFNKVKNYCDIQNIEPIPIIVLEGQIYFAGVETDNTPIRLN